MKTIGDVLDLLDRMAASSHLANHAATLIGPRTRGSTTERGLDALPRDRPITDITDKLAADIKSDFCKYYSVDAAELGCKLGAIPYAIAKDMATILRRPSPHGVDQDELYIDVAIDDAILLPSNLVTIIIGPPGEYGFENGVIWTWHPGKPMGVLKKDAQPTDATAVKTRRG